MLMSVPVTLTTAVKPVLTLLRGFIVLAMQATHWKMTGLPVQVYNTAC